MQEAAAAVADHPQLQTEGAMEQEEDGEGVNPLLAESQECWQE